ncbi:MAG TPA: aminopeptidase N, partial [Mycobacteriales bacterium]|nr:aminopeptidase N [Mycobacteriales bacterium]
MPVPNLTRPVAQTRADLLDLVSYEIEVDLTDGGGKPGEHTFRSTTTVRFGCREPGAGTFIDLIAAGIRSATLNGQPLEVSGYTLEDGLALPDLAADNTLVVDADCLYTNTGAGLHRFVDPVDGAVYLYSQFETADAKRMYACFDQPDLKATFSIRAITPYDWEVVSNARAARTSDAPGGAKLVQFATTPRLSTYVTALVAGPYHKVQDTHDGIDLGVYCRASLAEHLDADEIFQVTRQGFDWFHRAFSYRYPLDKYDQLFVPEFNAGAMENFGCVTFLEDYVFRSRVTDAAYERRADTILHEMAHMWFGDLVTMRWWDDLWLNESFASFVAVLCQSQATRWTAAWTTFANTEKTWAYKQDQLPSTHPVAADIPDLEAVEVNFDGITYAKGASVLKQLAAYAGIEAFLQGLRGYFRRYEYGNTTLADLLEALAEASGRDLSNWSAQWLQRAGINSIRADFTLDDEGRYASFGLVQSAPPDNDVLRDHRLAIGLYGVEGDKLIRVDRIELDVTGARTDVPELIGVVQPDLLLVNDDDLAYAKIRLDPESLARTAGHLSSFTSSMPRALILGASWDMTRDAEMAAHDFVDLVLENVAAETDSSVQRILLAQMWTSARFYSDPARRAALNAHLTARLRELTAAAAPGSDAQLQLLTAFAGSATNGADTAYLRDLLEGEQELPGRVI